jgi:hypothetical protein
MVVSLVIALSSTSFLALQPVQKGSAFLPSSLIFTVCLPHFGIGQRRFSPLSPRQMPPNFSVIAIMRSTVRSRLRACLAPLESAPCA